MIRTLLLLAVLALSACAEKQYRYLPVPCEAMFCWVG